VEGVRHERLELHVHLEGTATPTTLRRIAARNGHELPEDLDSRYGSFTGLQHFFETWVLTTNALQRREDFAEVAVEYAKVAAAQGITYIEGIISPAERVFMGTSTWEELEGWLDGAEQAADLGVTMRLTPDLVRVLPAELTEECARWCARHRDRGIVGLGMGGDEDWGPLAPYARTYEIAREGGVEPVPHCGEKNAGTVREALDLLNPPRIRHGIFAWIDQDLDLVQELAERGTVLDICLRSNMLLTPMSLEEHPLPHLVDAGVRCSVSTDDPAMLGCTFTEELELAAQLGVCEQTLMDAARHGALDA
jgi:aminodeoxyfutalosine deaminase